MKRKYSQKEFFLLVLWAIATRWLARLWGFPSNAYCPLLRAEFANGCLFDQADFLWRAGYYSAAVAMSRKAIEIRVYHLATLAGVEDRVEKKLPSSCMYLLSQRGDVDKDVNRKFLACYKMASRFVHTKEPTREEAHSVIHRAIYLRMLMDKAEFQILEKRRLQNIEMKQASPTQLEPKEREREWIM